jgi:GNAT superfamily N-acetyltransferase
VRPDERCSVWFRDCRDESYAPLLAAVAAAVDRDLYAELDESDAESLTRLVRLGFTVSRQENHIVIPTDPAVNGLGNRAGLPPAVSVISAADADEDRLRRLDDLLRQDVPGADGWRWEPAAFHAETFSSAFDPATYLVAVDSAGRYAGIARVWNNPVIPRLGLIAVTREHRRSGLARALLARAFGVLHGRGQPEVSAEVDSANRASLTLMTGLSARRTGGSVELIRRRPAGQTMNASLGGNYAGTWRATDLAAPPKPVFSVTCAHRIAWCQQCRWWPCM